MSMEGKKFDKISLCCIMHILILLLCFNAVMV